VKLLARNANVLNIFEFFSRVRRKRSGQNFLVVFISSTRDGLSTDTIPRLISTNSV
jgi:hypothetical protein